MNKKTIYLIRHGKIELHGKKTYIGSTDVPLSYEGIEQANKLKKYFQDIELEKAYCSNLKRSQHTAEIILQGREEVKIFTEKGLGEIHMGQWEGKYFEEIQKCYPKQYEERGKDIFNFRPPYGESFFDCNERVMDVFNKIIQTMKGNILIVGHAGVNRIILCNILQIPVKNLFKIQQGYCGLNEIIVEGPNNFQLRRMNQVCYRELSKN